MIITGVSGGGGGLPPYAFIKVLIHGTASVFAFIGDKCYGGSNVGNGVAMIPVSKKGTYTIKAYNERRDGTYSQELIRTATATVSKSNSVVTVAIDEVYGDYGNLSFSSTTDAQFAAIVSALDGEKITVDDLPWAVGDTRKVRLSAMPATGVGEPHYLEDVTFVIQNVGGVTLTSGKQCHYVVGLLNLLYPGGYMNSKNTNNGSWRSSARRAWCNNIFRNAIPETVRGCFKQFNCVTAMEYNSSANSITYDYFALPAEKEIFGDYNYSRQSEADALTQFEWYKTTANRTKTYGDGGTPAYWWERSPSSSFDNCFCNVYYANGTTKSYAQATESNGLSPFGCI